MALSKIDAANFLTGTIPSTNVANASLSSVTSLPAGVGGKVLQVVTSNFSTYVNSTSTSYVQSGLTASITPSSTSSKVLIFMNILGVGQNSATTSIRFKLVKNNTTDIIEFDDIGGYNSGVDIGSNTSHLNYLDSPATTSSTTYTMYFKRQQGSGVIFFNNYVSSQLTNSTITLMEIAG